MANASFIECRTFLERQQMLQQQQQKRLSRRIHDLVSNKLTLLSLQLSMAGIETSQPADWTQSCRNWSSMTVDLGHALREIINDLKPRILDETGFVSALRWYANTLPESFTCRVTAPDENVRVPTPFANEVFSVCRDIISGLVIPSGATEAAIELEVDDGMLRITLNPGLSARGEMVTEDLLASWFIAERMTYVAGSMEVTPTAGGLPIITLSVPLARRVAVRMPSNHEAAVAAAA